jgi:4-amino-4-deoxy-L-arabinose transferase-like glycosyltransferase
MQKRTWLIVAAILIIALGGAMRVWSLPRPPAGPYYDEAANGILAAGIANHGDRPLFITSYTGKEVLYFYLAALMVRLLGSNLLALRLTSALLGTLTIAATLWCAWELFFPRRQGPEKRRQAAVALFTAGLLATSFWHLVLSRVGLRAVAQPLLQALTLAMLWRGLRRSRWGELIVAGLFCGLLGYTYLAARLFPIPLALALLTLLVADRERWRQRLAQIGAFLAAAMVAFAPLGLYFLRNPERFAVRIEQVASQGATLTLPQAFARALGLFFVAGDPLPRINLPGQPVFGPIVAAAFLFGLALTVYRLVRERDPLDRARDVLLLAWIPAMILPTALTVADIVPHYLRAAGLLPLIYLFPAFAIAWLLERTPRWPETKHWLALTLLLGLTAPVAGYDYFVRLANREDHY